MIAEVTFLGGSLIIFFFLLKAKVIKENYYQDAIDLLKGYEPAVVNLGNPIKPKKFDQKDKFNSITNSQIKVGLLFFVWVWLSILPYGYNTTFRDHMNTKIT